ncbi:MAG: sigma-70 family RNA polymerase sigma factor [Bacteroidota bacterium]
MSNVYGHLSDSEIWKEFKSGSEEAFAFLYNQYVVPLYHYGNRLTTDRNMIEDNIQDLFIELWRNRATLGETNSIKFYLYKALKRRLIKNIINQRKQPFNLGSLDEYDFEMTLSPEFDLIAQQVSQAQKENLLAALNSLTSRQKEAITLKFYDELSYSEIASLMTMTIKAVYNLIFRAIEVLRANVEKVFLTILALYF